jgi:hypothetical protein
MTQHARRSRADAKTVPATHGTTTAAAAKMALSSLSVWFGLACALVGYVVGTYSIRNNEDPRRTVEDGASHFINVVQSSEEEDASAGDGLAWEDALSVKDLRAIVAIVLVLIALTVAFETAKEYLEESVSEDQEIILEKFFGELTVLGFLSMLTFLITQTGVIGHISEQVFGNEEELLEYFEYVYAVVVPVYLSSFHTLCCTALCFGRPVVIRLTPAACPTDSYTLPSFSSWSFSLFKS